ncbi:sigma-70 family RNA polymerase sigma factor [Xylophilus rhododendri]|uniref:Sigma-70 family RNA polymerase sigma factor n=1 Tax=Xylophilus rhododendri TaxID=2697032 RepID=A0A857J3P6_9BURK|nr:sigma-70 family RNA polymerase sigma factor [Xylophilus rhododendri]QHI97682.1 sigma-70 family RNA polymerase sigma factor [Xylophilus rhododendri]
MRPSPDGISAPPAFDYESALTACAQGDRQALQGLYGAESRRLLGMALRIVRTRDRAEDVLHDAFVRIWQGAASFDAARGSARGWMYSVLRNVALDHARRQQRDVSLDEDATEAAEDAAALAEHQDARSGAAERRLELGRLDDCLALLPEARRDCILLAYLDGCTHGEIAERLATPLGTVKAWITRSLKSLRECLA